MDGLREISLKLTRRERLQQDIVEEVRFLKLRHKDRALVMAREELRRDDLTPWGRLVAKGAAARLSRAESREARSWSPATSYWRPPWGEDPELN